MSAQIVAYRAAALGIAAVLFEEGCGIASLRLDRAGRGVLETRRVPDRGDLIGRLADFAVLMAGPAAELILAEPERVPRLHASPRARDHMDVEGAVAVASELFETCEPAAGQPADAFLAEVAAYAERLVDCVFVGSVDLLTAAWPGVEAVAEELLARGYLSGERVAAITVEALGSATVH